MIGTFGAHLYLPIEEEVRRTLLSSTTFYGSARRYDRGQLDSLTHGEVPARFHLSFG